MVLVDGETLDCDTGRIAGDICVIGNNVTIRNCSIDGTIRVHGPAGKNGQGNGVRESSLSAGHTARMQEQAPRGTVIEHNHITVAGRGIPVYLAPGVTRARVSHNTISGFGRAVAIYLDAESGHNEVTDNTIEFQSTSRELIAVDGSADNVFERNALLFPDNGGVETYRNCGEGGTVRHQTPSRNLFLASGPVQLNSRNGRGAHCDEDQGWPFGSSADNIGIGTDNLVE